VKPDVVVNAAAYTAVDKAEDDRDLANRINAEAPRVMAEEAEKLDALLVHYSTDYVFNGESTRPWQETDAPAPVNHYGAGKLAGEQAILATGCRHLIFRISWVFASRDRNFLASMQRLIKEKDALKVVADQIGAPTSAELVADVSAIAIAKTSSDPRLCGVYHLAPAGETSWHGYAVEIATWLQRQGIAITAQPEKIEAIPTPEYPTPAARPLNSRLDCGSTQAVFGIARPDWRAALPHIIDELGVSTT